MKPYYESSLNIPLRLTEGIQIQEIILNRYKVTLDAQNGLELAIR